MCCNCVMHLEGHRWYGWYGWYVESKHWPTSTNTFDASWHITVTSPTRLLVLLPHLLHGKIVLSTFFHQSGFQTWHEDIYGYLEWFIYDWTMIKLRGGYLWYLEALHMCPQQIASGATAVKPIAKWGKYGNTEENSHFFKPSFRLWIWKI